MLSRSERGDTLIEVLFATAVFALLIVLSLGIMNAGTAQAERAVEGTFVRQAIDSQTELLRYQRDAYVNKTPNVWAAIRGQRVNDVLAFDRLKDIDSCTPAAAGQRAFYLATNAAAPGGVSVRTDFSQPVTYAGPGKGLWIQATSANMSSNYTDFYIYACWDAPGSGPKATSGTIVRLYAPVE